MINDVCTPLSPIPKPPKPKLEIKICSIYIQAVLTDEKFPQPWKKNIEVGACYPQLAADHL